MRGAVEYVELSPLAIFCECCALHYGPRSLVRINGFREFTFVRFAELALRGAEV